MAVHGICMYLEEGTLRTEAGRATLALTLQQIDAATRASMTPAQYARLTPADYTWTTGHNAGQKPHYVHVRIREPALPALLAAKL